MKKYLLLMLLVLLSACGTTNFEDELVGKWDFADSDGFSGTYDFKENGTVLVDSIVSISGPYVVEDDVITIDEENVFTIEKTDYGFYLQDVDEEERYIELHEQNK
ncbi:MAG: hypothetical protein UHX00_01315 [Caryophanon sp.]|nr:hypothetical protein [Caryophanon sp.]